MKAEQIITSKAAALIGIKSMRWLAQNLHGIKDTRTVKKRLQDHAWTIDQATVINNYYERLIETL
jgi:hypothetical protein